MGNSTTCEPDNDQRLRETEIRQQEETRKCIPRSHKEIFTDTSDLVETANRHCQQESDVRWIADSVQNFSELVALLKKHIVEEEQKNHGDYVDIIFWAHGSIGLPLIPASCLLPLPNIRDVVLYSPWNCVTVTDVTYGVATGKIEPQHREFYCGEQTRCQVPDKKHRPTKLPDRWNSLKHAVGWKIPTITVSPIEPTEDGVWKRFESLRQKHGPPGKNRILIPFVLPGQSRVPFSVVTLALSLVLLSSRFTATVHLCSCLRDQTGDLRVYEDYLRQQYAYAGADTGMRVSEDVFRRT